MRIAYVEDNPTNLALVERIVKMANHSVVSYTEGEEALDALKRETFDLILMDVELAGVIGGLEVVRQLRTHGLKTPIVAVTAYAMMGDRDKCIQAGCDDYLPKPLPITDFIQLLARFDAVTKQRSISAALSTSTVPAVVPAAVAPAPVVVPAVGTAPETHTPPTLAEVPIDPDATSPVPAVAPSLQPVPTLSAAAPSAASAPGTVGTVESAPPVQPLAPSVEPVAVPVSTPTPSTASTGTASASTSSHVPQPSTAPIPTPPLVNNTPAPSEPPQTNSSSVSPRETSP